MRRFSVYNILILTIFAVVITAFTTGLYRANIKTVSAETIVTNRLEYFELDKPLAVDRDGDVVYIAQKDMIIIYHDETYDKINVDNADITHIEKCGNHLLFLNANKLFSLNLATNEISPVLFEGVSSVSVKQDYFAINQATKVRFFEVTDKENFLFSEVHPQYSNGEVIILNESPSLALAPDLTFYYFATDNKNVQDMNSSGRQGCTFEHIFESIEQMFFDYENNALYIKSKDLIYRYLFESKTLETLFDFASQNMTNCGRFAVDGNLLLICDTFGDRVVEYDLQTLAPTGFEISFTKINLPQDFGVDYNANPQYVTVNKGEKLYDINFDASTEKGYFLFNGYHEQAVSGNYLVINEINDIFYLVSGDCYALVLKEDYTPKAVNLTAKENCFGYMTNNGKVYKYPKLLSQFISFDFSKHEKVQITHTLDFNGVEYAIIKKGENSGFIPTSFILDEIYVAPEHNSYTTATVGNKAVAVYGDKELANKIFELEKYSTVIIIEELDNCYHVKFNGNETGYIQKSAIVKRGSYTNKIVFVVILCALSLTITAIHFELKYLYKRKKTLQQ